MTDDALPIRLRPLARTRVANLVGSALIAGAGALSVWGGLVVRPTALGWVLAVLGVPFLFYGLVVGIRSIGLGIVLTADTAVVRGLLSTARVPRSAIREVTAYPSLVWTDARGRARRTPITALNLYRSGAVQPIRGTSDRVDAMLDTVRDWVVAGGGSVR